MTKAPCKFHLLQGACSSPVVCSAPLFLPCSLQGYRLRCLCPGRNAAWPQRAAALDSLSRASAAAMMHCRSGTLQSSRRLVGACLKPAPTKADAESAKVPDQRSTTTRRYRPSGFARARAARRGAPHPGHTHHPRSTSGDMNATPIFRIIARDLSSARFIGARSASPASSPIAGLARRLPASTAQAQPRARLDLPRGRRVPIPGDDIGPHGIGPQLSREAWSTQTSASSDLSINVRRWGNGPAGQVASR